MPFILEDGQIIGRLVYEPLTEAPERVYGQGIGSNYQRQGLKLSKHFKAVRPGAALMLLERLRRSTTIQSERGRSSVVERQLPKLHVVSSILIARSNTWPIVRRFGKARGKRAPI